MENEAKITVQLSDGMLVTIPFKNCRETLKRMEDELKSRQEKETKEE